MSEYRVRLFPIFAADVVLIWADSAEEAYQEAVRRWELSGPVRVGEAVGTFLGGEVSESNSINSEWFDG